MKIFCTGATGFVGAHTARALLEAGHELRLLVRNADLARNYFAQHGHLINDIVVADIRDAEVIRKAIKGCDAVFHAAATVSLDPRKAQETYDNNVGGMKAVIGSAVDAGIHSILYVSSLSVIFHPGLPCIDEATPLADVKEPYSRSKRDSDEYVRGLQQRGAPIQISYPAGVIGPDDPKLSEANHGLVAFISQMLPRTTTGFQTVDGRDLAQAHRWLLEHAPSSGFEDRLYIVGGHFYPWAELHALLERVLARRIFAPRVPAPLLRGMGAATDFAKKIVPFQTQVSSEAMAYVTQWPPADSSKFLRTSGLSFRSGAETIEDTVRWLVHAGHLHPKYAGRLAA